MDNTTGQKNLWLRSSMWDGFWMLSGIWLLAPLFAFLHTPNTIQTMLIVATLILWLSHRFATTYNAFCVPAYHELTKLYRTRFLIWPVSAVLATFAFVFAPLPFTTWEKVQILGTIFFLYNSYHFGVQHYGVLSIYRIRAGQGHTGWLKKYERTYCLVVGSILVAIAQVCHGAEVVSDSILYNFLPRDLFSSLFAVLRLTIPPAIVALTAAFYIGELKSKPVSLPKILYVTGLMLQGILAYFLPPISFLILWGVQHWLVSVALSVHMTQNDASQAPATSRWYGFWGRFNKGFWPTVFILGIISIVLTPFFQFAVHPEKLSSSARFLSFISPFITNAVIANLFIAINFSTVYIHFIMDRAIFRFSDPATRKVTATLLFAQKA